MVSRDPRQRSVPRGRLARLGQFGRLASGVAGGMLAEGARRLADGERPHIRDLVLTPGNVAKVADRLSHLRGAAMKLGQMISMDAGDMLPPELAEVMGRLRENAHHMPPGQLKKVLDKEWGKGWRAQFAQFDPRPMAAASIGQVHRATTLGGRELAIKVQYPGVRESIDADVDNVATLLRLSNLLPRELEIDPVLAAAKAQLAEEADYEREGTQMTRFGTLLADMPEVVLPELVPEFTTGSVLAMTFLPGQPVEMLENADQGTRDAVMCTLMMLVLRELFEFGMMQTDPNFANYRYQAETGRLVLLDFGAARPIEPATVESYQRLLLAALAGDCTAVREAAVAGGLLAQATLDRHGARVDMMIDLVLEQVAQDDPFDFADRSLVGVLREEGVEVAQDKATWLIPPADILFVQRKISGTALLAARLKARVDVRALVSERLGATMVPEPVTEKAR